MMLPPAGVRTCNPALPDDCAEGCWPAGDGAGGRGLLQEGVMVGRRL